MSEKRRKRPTGRRTPPGGIVTGPTARRRSTEVDQTDAACPGDRQTDAATPHATLQREAATIAKNPLETNDRLTLRYRSGGRRARRLSDTAFR